MNIQGILELKIKCHWHETVTENYFFSYRIEHAVKIVCYESETSATGHLLPITVTSILQTLHLINAYVEFNAEHP